MSQVGSFPGISGSNRRTIRGVINPLDKSTIISIYPKEIHDRKPTIQPGIFDVPAGTYEHPAILVVGPSSWWREIDEEQPLLEIPQSSIQIADSIVKDYCNGLLACNMGDCMPGLSYLPGEYTVEQIKKQHLPLLVKMQAAQKKWFMELVKIADVLWSRSNGNPLAISNDARLAARELNLNNKPWLLDYQTVELVNCTACGNMRNPMYPVCPACHAVVDKQLAEKLGIAFSK